MLYLVTGTPGSGKTLNTIKFVRESKSFEGRDVYYFGIKNLNPEFGWIELDEKGALTWFNLPSGSVILFDEAYNIFPAKHAMQGSPEHVKNLAVHRHKGFDVFLICQKVIGQLDSFTRGLVNRHQHYARIMGSLNINRFTWDICQENPNSAGKRKDANVDQFRMDKKYFGAYHSADEHTHTLSVPWKKIVILLVLVGILVASVYSFLSYFDRGKKDKTGSYATGYGPSGVASAPGDPLEIMKKPEQLSFAELVKPEVLTLPWSAPLYREKFSDVQDWPRPAACYSSERTGCKCFTQQASPLDVSETLCESIVRGGYFDHTKPVDRDPAAPAAPVQMTLDSLNVTR
jgi:zona occludens toxin